MGVFDELGADFEHSFGRKGRLRSILLMAALRSGFRAVVLYRLGRWGRCHGLRWQGAVAERLIHLLCRIDIATEAKIGEGLAIPHSVGIVIGARSAIGKRCRVLQGVTLGGSGKVSAMGQTQPRVGDDCTLGAGAKLLGPIAVGNRCVIGANAVVTSDVLDDSTVVGVPARVVRRAGQVVRREDDLTQMSERIRELTQRVQTLEERVSLAVPLSEAPECE